MKRNKGGVALHKPPKRPQSRVRVSSAPTRATGKGLALSVPARNNGCIQAGKSCVFLIFVNHVKHPFEIRHHILQVGIHHANRSRHGAEACLCMKRMKRRRKKREERGRKKTINMQMGGGEK